MRSLSFHLNDVERLKDVAGVTQGAVAAERFMHAQPHGRSKKD